MAAEALIPALIQALGLGAAGTAAKGTMDMMNSDTSKTRVLGDGLTDKLAETPKNGVKPKEISKADKDEIMLLLAEGGLSTREINKIEKTGFLPKEQFIRLPEDIQKKLAKLTGQDVDALLAGIGGNDFNDDDDEETKKKKQKKAEETKKKVRKEIDRAKQYDKGEKEFQAKDPKNVAKSNQERWGKTEYDFNGKNAKAESARKTNDPLRRNKVDYVNNDDPKMRSLSPGEKADMLNKQRAKAIKNGTVQEWDYNHIKPLTNLPVR